MRLFKKHVIFIGLILGLSACGSENANQPASKSEPGNQPLAPQISLESISDDECINLEKWSKAINQEKFSFPSRVFTNDLKGENLHPRFLAYSFGFTETELKNFPRFSEISQPSCNEVIIKNSYGRNIAYTVTEATERSLTLEKVDEAEESEDESEEEDEASEAVLEAYDDEILARKIKVEWLGPTSLRLTEATDTFQPLCDAFKKIPYEKTITVQWAEARNRLSNDENIQKTYYDQILKLIKVPEMPDLADLPDLDSLPSRDVESDDAIIPENSEEDVSSNPTKGITVDQAREVKEKLMAQAFAKDCQ